MNLADAGTTTVALPVWLQAALAIIATLGGAKIVQVLIARRNAKADSRATETAEVAEVNAQAGGKMLEALLRAQEKQIGSMELQLRDMRQQHMSDISALKEENKTLARRLEDYRGQVEDYRIGRAVPKGMVLLPITHVKMVRHEKPGLLPMPWYPGEDQSYDLPGDVGVNVHLSPLPEDRRP